MNEVFSHTGFDGYDWKNEIKNYSYNKTHTSWGKASTNQPRVTAQMVKSNENIYNPILQTYSDLNYDNKLRQKEKSDIINEIVKNQDNRLKVEQTFNIINLQDRLKGFEKHPNYPVMKDLIHSRKRIESNPKNFNIISNYPLSEHHFDKPENRPKYSNSAPKEGKNMSKNRREREFDIISNRYKYFNDEKNEVDRDIKKIKTAQIFYKKNDYNPIKGKFYNNEKEEEFLKKRKEEQKNWGIERFNNLPKCVKGKSDIYNLITLKIVDQKEMDRMIQEEKNKTQRYGLRYKLEKYYRDESMKQLDKQENRKNGKASYLRYKEQDKRQFDIIDLKDRPYNQHKDIIKSGGINEWEKIINGAGNNNTFDIKKIYKDPYDYSETGSSYDLFQKKRNNTLSKLPKIENDILFNKIKKEPKCESHKKKIIISEYESNHKDKFMNKEKFFLELPKSINAKIKGNKIDGNFQCHTTYAEGSRISKMFKENQEKNMRNYKKALNLKMEKNK